jgi:ribosomal protein S18 acetylase RimI-like enzyme
MVLRLDEVPATSQRPQVRLVAMPEDRFAGWREESIEGYALDMETSTTLDHEQSVARSRAEFADLLPAGLATPDHHLFDVRADEATVGTLWLARRSPRAFFVYDVVIDAAARGRGLGRAAMDAAARWCRDRGADVLGLNVFGQNQVARRLYDSLGYRVVLEELTLRLR